MLANNWQLVVSRNWAMGGDKIQPFVVPHNFSSQVIKTETNLANIPLSWYRAGYVQQVISLLPVTVVTSKSVLLNKQKILPLPLVDSTYQIIFTPMKWLTPGLRLKIWEYQGEVSTETLNQLLLIE